MSGRFVVSNGNVTITFEYTAPISKAQETVFACALSVYDQFPVNQNVVGNGQTLQMQVPFDQLTVQQKLDVVDRFVLDAVLSRAIKQHEKDLVNAAMQAAREAAGEEAREKFI